MQCKSINWFLYPEGINFKSVYLKIYYVVAKVFIKHFFEPHKKEKKNILHIFTSSNLRVKKKNKKPQNNRSMINVENCFLKN